MRKKLIKRKEKARAKGTERGAERSEPTVPRRNQAQTPPRGRNP